MQRTLADASWQASGQELNTQNIHPVETGPTKVASLNLVQIRASVGKIFVIGANHVVYLRHTMSRSARLLRTKSLLPLSGVVLLLACPLGPSEESPEALECDVPKLFEERCGGSACHDPGDSTAAGLDLTSPGVDARVSGVPGLTCAGFLANPADPESSLLYTKTQDPDLAQVDAPCGSRMPVTGAPLTDEEMLCMRDWISGLAAPDECSDCICEPGVVEACYSGPEGTADVGLCRSGTHMCHSSGMGWSACEGEVGPRGENCFTHEDEDCDGATPECSETWALGFGNEFSQAMRSVTVDSAGNVYTLGDFDGEVGFGGDPLTATLEKSDIVITKHDRHGNPIWSLRNGDSSNQYGAKLILDGEGNLILLGRIYGAVDFGGGPLEAKGSGDLLVVKLDSDGNHVWSRAFGDKDPERAERVVVDSHGNVILTGTFTTAVDFGGGTFTTKGMRDAFVLMLDGGTGAHRFSRQIGGVGDDYGFGIDVDANDNIVVAGRFQADVGLGPDLDSTLTSMGGTDIYLAKIGADGAVLWSQSYGGLGADEVHDLRVQTSGEIVMLGSMFETVDFGGSEGVRTSNGMRDIFVATFDGNGDHVWSRNYGDAGDQFTSSYEVNAWLSLALGPTGTIHFGGGLFGSADFGGGLLTASGSNADVVHVELDSEGSYRAATRYGGAGTDLALDLDVTESGHVVMAGRWHSDELDFGSAGILRNRGLDDGFIAKLAPMDEDD